MELAKARALVDTSVELSTEARLKQLVGGSNRVKNGRAIILELGQRRPVQHEGDADTTRCYFYCRHLERWMLSPDTDTFAEL